RHAGRLHRPVRSSPFCCRHGDGNDRRPPPALWASPATLSPAHVLCWISIPSGASSAVRRPSGGSCGVPRPRFSCQKQLDGGDHGFGVEVSGSAASAPRGESPTTGHRKAAPISAAPYLQGDVGRSVSCQLRAGLVFRRNCFGVVGPTRAGFTIWTSER